MERWTFNVGEASGRPEIGTRADPEQPREGWWGQPAPLHEAHPCVSLRSCGKESRVGGPGHWPHSWTGRPDLAIDKLGKLGYFSSPVSACQTLWVLRGTFR